MLLAKTATVKIKLRTIDVLYVVGVLFSKLQIREVNIKIELQEEDTLK